MESGLNNYDLPILITVMVLALSAQPAQGEQGLVTERNTDLRATPPPKPPAPAQSESQGGIPTPELDDQQHERLMEQMRRRIPRHTPQWREHNRRRTPPGYRLDIDSGKARFGDGVHGRRPPADDSHQQEESQPNRHAPEPPDYDLSPHRKIEVPDANAKPSAK